MAFSRMDRKTQPREPIATKYVAQLLESVGTNRIICCDIHNLSSFQCSFRINTDNLEAKNLFAKHVAATIKNHKNIAVLSPDSGGMSRASRFRNALNNILKENVGLAYLDKSRSQAGDVSGNHIVGDVKDKQVVIIDDMISSGKTIKQCVDTVKSHGGTVWAICATHGLFVGKVNDYLAGVNKIIITDTINHFDDLDKSILEKIEIVSTTEMFAKAIRRTNQGGSISSLLKD
jgi:ribose-phosphate pyrophosphokinase